MIFNIRVIPNARKTEIVDRTPGFLKIKLAAPAMNGKANKALIRFLAQEFDIPKSEIMISKGEKGRDKIINVNSKSEYRNTKQAQNFKFKYPKRF